MSETKDKYAAVLHVTGTPRPKQSARFVDGRAVSIAAARKLLKLWTATLVTAGRKWVAEGGQTFDGALRVDIDFYMPTRKAERWGDPHTFVPDKDNLEKAVLDAIKKAGVIADDRRVSSGLVSKWWAENGGAVIVVRQIGEHRDIDDPDDMGAEIMDGAEQAG